MKLTQAATDVLAERQRQIDALHWTPVHDDGHADEALAAMAVYYAMPAGMRQWPAAQSGYGETLGEAVLLDGWQPKEQDRRRELVKAGALILAEIERLDRAAECEE